MKSSTFATSDEVASSVLKFVQSLKAPRCQHRAISTHIQNTFGLRLPPMGEDCTSASLGRRHADQACRSLFAAGLLHGSPALGWALPASIDAVPATEKRLRRARTLLRVLWQGYDAEGHSNGRSQACLLLEMAMDLMGLPDPGESRQADLDLVPLLEEAKTWRAAIRGQAVEDHLRRMDVGKSRASEAIALEIATGFESRMR